MSYAPPQSMKMDGFSYTPILRPRIFEGGTKDTKGFVGCAPRTEIRSLSALEICASREKFDGS